jgi:hypothetical protein
VSSRGDSDRKVPEITDHLFVATKIFAGYQFHPLFTPSLQVAGPCSRKILYQCFPNFFARGLLLASKNKTTDPHILADVNIVSV